MSPGVEAAGVAGQRVPGAIGQRAIEGDADARIAAAGAELGGDDPCVVGDEDVAAPEQVGQVGHFAVLETIGHIHQACRIARTGGLLGDAFGRQREVEVARPHSAR
jgi:hypothetical protein